MSVTARPGGETATVMPGRPRPRGVRRTGTASDDRDADVDADGAVTGTTGPDPAAGGRTRGPRGLARAWIGVMTRPRRFFRTAVVPGDQAPGLSFAVAVALAFVGGWMAASPGVVPGVVGSRAVSAAVVLLAVGLLAAPAGLHLTAAVAAVTVAAVARDRAGVSETVQVVAYASAPMALAGPPVPALRVACGLYATALLATGLWVVHDTDAGRAVLAAAPAAVVGFGLCYRTTAAARTLLGL